MKPYFADAERRKQLIAELELWLGTPFQRQEPGQMPEKKVSGGCNNTLCVILAAVGALALDEYLPLCEQPFSPADPSSSLRQQSALNRLVYSGAATEIPVVQEQAKAVVDSPEMAGDLLLFRQTTGMQALGINAGERVCYCMTSARGFVKLARSQCGMFGQLIRIVRINTP